MHDLDRQQLEQYAREVLESLPQSQEQAYLESDETGYEAPLATPGMPTTNLKRVRLGLRGQLSGWAVTEIALAVDPRLAPIGGWVPRPPKRLGRKRY